MKEIDRHCFISLNKDKLNSHHYIVLNDGNYLDEFWADSDHEAQEIFREGWWG